MSLELNFISLFPERLKNYLSYSLLGKALENKTVIAKFLNLRDFGLGHQKQVDDYPYAKQSGMLLRVDVLSAAIRSIPDYQEAQLIYLDPKGQTLNQAWLRKTVESCQRLILISGFYEGVDARLFELFPITRISVGDYVLSSGDLPALTVAEALIRLLPNYVENPEPIQTDSFYTDLLEAPRYTRPADFEGHAVPEYLLSGNHAQIKQQKAQIALKETLKLKPKMLLQNFINSDTIVAADLVEEMSRIESDNRNY